MKKYLVILVVLLLIITGCGKKEEKFKKPENIGNSDKLVLVYESIQGSVKGSPAYKVSLYNDSRMITEYTNEDGFRTINLSEEEYQKIIDIAFSEEFLTLEQDLTTMETEGGSVEYITVYYDATSFRVGGQHIKNSTFNKLEELLLSYK